MNSNGYLVESKFIDSYSTLVIAAAIGRVFNPICEKYGVENIFELYKVNKEAYVSAAKMAQNLHDIQVLGIQIYGFLRNNNILEDPIMVTKPVLHMSNKNLAEDPMYHLTPAHQDMASVQSSISSVVCWIPLVDVKDVGPLEVVPGSHLKGAQWSSREGSFGLVEGYEDKDFVSIDMKAGDMLIFSQLLVHRSGENKTEDKVRMALSFRFGDLAAKDWIDRDYYSPYIYKPVVDKEFRP